MSNPNDAYDLHRSELSFNSRPSVDGSADESLYYTNNSLSSSVTHPKDATETVKEMHLALLYLLTNPEEFQKAIRAQPPQGTTTLAEWNAEYSEYDDDNESVLTAETLSTPLPFVVFASDAEVVLPQSHTASQLFGIEQIEGVELEAAAGIPRISQLFLRWLALMPQGDHLNILDPPVVMKIAGGRYRVTAAHRCVWTWMNEFGPIHSEAMPASSTTQTLQLGDLVTMKIVDVFETDSNGKLLSYCPTFDCRAVCKTNPTRETIRKSSYKLFTALGRAQRAQAGIMEQAKMVAGNVRHKVDEVVQTYNSPNRRVSLGGGVTDAKQFEKVMTAAEEAANGLNETRPVDDARRNAIKSGGEPTNDGYFSTDDEKSAEI